MTEWIDQLSPRHVLAFGILLGALAFYVSFRLRLALPRSRDLRAKLQAMGGASKGWACSHCNYSRPFGSLRSGADAAGPPRECPACGKSDGVSAVERRLP